MVTAPPKPQDRTPEDGVPRVTSRSKRAWRLLRRAKSFYLVHQSVTYFVDRSGWARPLQDTKSWPLRASKLLDPAKRDLNPNRRS